jgi:hypothetical protein
MSLRGFKRWQHYNETGVWLPLVVTRRVDYGGGDTTLTETFARTLLAQSIRESPFAVQHIVGWTNNVMTPEYWWIFENRYVYDKSRSLLTLETPNSEEGWFVQKRFWHMTDEKIFARGAQADRELSQTSIPAHTNK